MSSQEEYENDQDECSCVLFDSTQSCHCQFFSSVVLHAPASMNLYLLTGLGVASNKNIRYAVGEGDVVFNTDPSMVGEVRERCLIPARGGSDG
jgi:hypothetical protein